MIWNKDSLKELNESISEWGNLCKNKDWKERYLEESVDKDENPNNLKYKIMKSETKRVENHTLYRIKALKDITTQNINLSKGDLGGWIENEDCLSQEGDSWVSDDAVVYNGSIVSGNALVCGTSRVYHFSSVSDNAIISDGAIVESSQVYDNAVIQDDVEVRKSEIYGNAKVKENAFIDKSKVYGTAIVGGNVELYEEDISMGIRENDFIG